MCKSAVCVLATFTLVVAASAQADILYSTDFEAPTFSLGTINGQDNWIVGNGDGTSTDGMIVDDGTGNQLLQVTSSTGGWGVGSKRTLDADSTKRYLIAELDFYMPTGPGDAFWFMDCSFPGIHEPESIFWDWDVGGIQGRSVCGNTQPDTSRTYFAHGRDSWYHVGILVDQQSKQMLQFNFDGVWYDVTDTPDTPNQMHNFVIRSWSPGTGGDVLWIDNLVIRDSDTLEIPGDVDGNGVVDGLDLTAVITAWLSTPGDPNWNPDADLDDSGVVDGLDLTEVISNWSSASAVPEPATLSLLALGALALVRRKHATSV